METALSATLILYWMKTTNMPIIWKARHFILGLGFKVLLANRVGTLWNEVCTIGFESISTPLAWLGSLAYSMQLYFDFCGYSLMAIGLGKMLGFTIPELGQRDTPKDADDPESESGSTDYRESL